jgi:hypothetical protein
MSSRCGTRRDASLGHTGRTLVAGRGTITIYVLVTLAAVLRLLAPLTGTHYILRLAASGFAWSGASGLFVLLYAKSLALPRVGDGSWPADLARLKDRSGYSSAFSGEIGEILVDEIIPDGFLRLSDAVDRLAQGIWGGLRRPAPVRAAKREDKRARIGFGPWKQEAGKRLRRAAIDGKLAIYAFAKPLTAANNQSQMPVAVSPTVLRRLIASRETLPDHPFRPTLKTTAGDQKTLELLQNGILLAAEQEFNHWYHSERAKRRWASQQSTLKRKEGRPSKQTQALKNAVINAMHKQKTSIVELHRRLLASGRTDVPSPDTLGRLVHQLFRETGDQQFLIRRRRRRPSR